MWSAELDVLFGKGVYSLGSNRPQSLTNTTETSYNADHSPILVETGPVTLSPEFVSYILALIIFSIRYASVYWYTNASFSAIFAFILLLCTLHHVFAYCGMGVLYKFGINLHAVGGLSLVLSPRAVMVLHVISCLIMIASMLCVFNYGYCHYVESCRRFLKVHFPTYARYVAKMPVGCHGYVPHGFATISLVMFIALRAPIVYDYVTVYRMTSFRLILTCIVIDACYMVLWIGLWFCITIKQTWDFAINPQMDIVQNSQRNTISMLSRQNGHAAHTDLTVIGSTGRSDVNRNNRNQSLNGSTVTNSQSSGITQSDEEDKESYLNKSHNTSSVPKPQREDSIIAKEEPNKVPKPPRKYDKPILKSLNIENVVESENNLDDEPVSTTPISPTSALKKSGLRKSGERRNNSTQRVTFDDSVDQIVDAEVSNLTSDIKMQPLQQQQSPKRKTKSRIIKEQNSSQISSKPEVNSCNLKPDGTPDNTLTRNYRSSLRDKCGEYYKHLGGDLGVPPAAQSSPRPRERPYSDSFDLHSNGDILLTSISKGDKRQTDVMDITGSMLSPVQPVNDGKFKDLYDPLRAGVNNMDSRLRDTKRLSGRKSNDENKAYSYPPKLYSPMQGEIQDIPDEYDHAVKSCSENIDNGIKLSVNSYLQSMNSPNSNSTNSTSYDSYYPNLYQDSSKLSSNSSKNYKNKNGLVPYVKSLPAHLKRPLNVSAKPDLSRRDSALPSSNETSSNDSADHMLCSQV